MYNKPLAYFITFTTYGTWLHGDPRKSILVKNHSTRRLDQQTSFLNYEQQHLNHPVVILDKSMRRTVLEAIIEHCLWEKWQLFAAHVRSNHTHVLVCSERPADKVMSSLKAWGTRKIRQSGCNLNKVWTRHGSTNYIFTKPKLLEKVHYIVYEQGEMMEYYIDSSLNPS